MFDFHINVLLFAESPLDRRLLVRLRQQWVDSKVHTAAVRPSGVFAPRHGTASHLLAPRHPLAAGNAVSDRQRADLQQGQGRPRHPPPPAAVAQVVDLIPEGQCHFYDGDI